MDSLFPYEKFHARKNHGHQIFTDENEIFMHKMKFLGMKMKFSCMKMKILGDEIFRTGFHLTARVSHV